MENPDAYRAEKDLVEFEWRQNHMNFYSSFSLKFYQENDTPLLTGWFPSQSGGDEIRESRTDAFSNPIPWQLTWVQWFALQNMLAESDLPTYRKPSSDSYDETDSEIRIVWRTNDGDETQTLSGSHAEALEALVLGIAEEAYAASKLETEQREVRETAELIGNLLGSKRIVCRVIASVSFLISGRSVPARRSRCFSPTGIRMATVSQFSGRMQLLSRRKRRRISAASDKSFACWGFRFTPASAPDGVVDNYIAATWQDGGEVFTNNYCGNSAQSIFNLLAAFAEETEAGIFSRPVPDGGWKCPECGMPNGSSVFCAECGAKRPAES